MDELDELIQRYSAELDEPDEPDEPDESLGCRVAVSLTPHTYPDLIELPGTNREHNHRNC